MPDSEQQSAQGLPPALAQGLTIRGAEHAWELSAFPQVLRAAPDLGYACLGGQFWFLLGGDSLHELYWLPADSSERSAGEPWADYATRSCAEVQQEFERILNHTDFDKEVAKFRSTTSAFSVKFNAYFVTEREWKELQAGPFPH